MNDNDNRTPRRPIENMRIPSIEERKTPYVRPVAHETHEAPKPQSDVAPKVTPSNEISDDNIGIPAPAMDYYPLAGRKRKVSYGPSSADIEAYSFLALLVSMIALVVFVLCAYSGYIWNKATGSYVSVTAQVSDKILSGSAVSPLSESDYFGSNGSTDPVNPGAPYDYSNAVPISSPADDSYFSDAVFVGDSRTEGLWLYSKIKSTFICERGLNVSKFFSDTLDKYSGKTAFEELCSTECNKIYISFGINEIGWVSSAFIKQYSELIDKVKDTKPEAIIYVQNIFPMSKEQSDKSVYGDNAKLREYNDLIADMCVEKEVYLLDVASYFSDENGDLKSSYETGVDGAHFKAGGQGYLDWANYIRSHTVGQ